MKYLSAIVFMLLFIACTDNNPTNFFEANSSSETPLSSSVSVESSSSLDILSSSVEIEYSSSELSSSSASISYGTLIDERDGQVYKTVKIGEQTWMAENLNYAYLKPFDDQDSSSWCYNNDPEKCAKYGRLYTWAAAVDSASWDDEEFTLCWYKDSVFNLIKIQGACPRGWHVPSPNEWFELEIVTDYTTTPLKSAEGWIYGNGTDIYGFGILPAGDYFIGHEWTLEGYSACFWSTLETSNSLITSCPRPYHFAEVFRFFNDYNGFDWKDYQKSLYACSVRCVKDDAAE